MMKKLFLVAAVALLATPLFAQDMKMDAKLGYARGKDLGLGGPNGFNVNPGLFYSLYSSDGFIKDFSIGGDFDFAMTKATGTWFYSVFIGPMARLEMPYSYFKLGFGYDYVRVAGVNNNLFGMKFNLGGLYPIAEGMRLGLDFGMSFAFNQGNLGARTWLLTVGPVFSFDL